MSQERQRNKVLIVGMGGREHALARQYGQSPHVSEVFVAPGHTLMQEGVSVSVVATGIPLTDKKGIVEFSQRNGIQLIDVAQDDAVQADVAGFARFHEIPTVGPDSKAGEVEWNKELGRKTSRGVRGVAPEARAYSANQLWRALRYLDNKPDGPVALKAAFLAAGKGVLKANNNVEAKELLPDFIRRFPTAARRFLIEEWMLNEDGTAGEEFSAFFLCDGINWKFLANAQDYKRVDDFDEGENTGGMGSNSPTLLYTPEIQSQTEVIADKTFSKLRKLGRPYRGVLYVSGLVVERGGKKKVKVVEFNSRWGDSEAQVTVPGFTNDFFEMNWAAANGDLRNIVVARDGKSRVAVTGASRGYPGPSEVDGRRIYGIEDAMKLENTLVFFAGARKENGYYVARGGRLLYVVGEGNNTIEAKGCADFGINLVTIPDESGQEGLKRRGDIGYHDLRREQAT